MEIRTLIYNEILKSLSDKVTANELRQNGACLGFFSSVAKQKIKEIWGKTPNSAVITLENHSPRMIGFTIFFKGEDSQLSFTFPNEAFGVLKISGKYFK